MNIDLADIENRILASKDDFKNITILEKTFEKETSRDDLSEIIRLTLHYEKDRQKDRKSFFIKVPYGNLRYEELKSQSTYSREIYVYTTLFPQYKRLLPHGSLHPEFYGTDGKDVLILEDLHASGYERAENAQLNATQFTVALRKLAKFHALSVKVRQSQPQIVNDPKTCNVAPPFDGFSSNDGRRAALRKQFRKLVDQADATFSAAHPQLLLYFENCLPEIFEGLRIKSDTKLDVLNHGHVYTKNVWFAYDDLGEVANAKFTDFRYCHWGSPITDLILFVISSLPFEEFESTFNTLLRLYTSTFNATLQKLKCDQRLTVEGLRGDINSHYEYFLYILVGIAPRDEEASHSGSHKFESKEYVNAELYDKLSKLWMSHIIEKGVFSKHEDLAIAIHTFVDSFETKNQTTVSSYEVDRTVVKPGDNFCSLIVRLKFEYADGEELVHGSVLLKVPSLSLNYEGLKETNVYNQEIFVYQKIFADMYARWKSEPLAPVCYAISEAKILVLEDLSVRGYRLGDKLKQLDLEHCSTALKTMATHHAISIEYLGRCDEAIRAQLTEPFNVTGAVRTLSRTLYSKFLRVMKPLVGSSLHSKMEALQEEIPKDAIYGRYADDDGLNVLGHCDYWTNNILFGYDQDGHPSSAKIIDWQLSRLASPVVDLIFFFVTSARFEIFETHKDTLLNFYLDTFNRTLSTLDAKLVYTRSDLDDAFRRYKYYFWLYVGTELPFVMANDGSYDNEANSDVASEHFLAVAQKWVHYLEKENLI